METEFGNRLRTLREQRDLTMEMLADDMNTKYGLTLGKGTISRWENGTTDPAISFVVCVEDYFNVSVDYLAGLTDISAPSRLLAYTKRMTSATKRDWQKEVNYERYQARDREIQNQRNQERKELLRKRRPQTDTEGSEGTS